jgi:senataxin
MLRVAYRSPPGTGKTKTVIGIVGALLTPTTTGSTIQIPGAQHKPKSATKKILVCAPSNAAVDELVIRFKGGVRTAKGDQISPAIVRIGRSDAINSTVRDVTLEELIERRMAPTTDASRGKTIDLDELRQKHTTLMDERNRKAKQLDECRAKQLEPPAGLQVEIDGLNESIREQRRNLDLKRDQKRESSRNAEVLRRRVQQEIMDEAQIICATLSGSGHEMLRNINVDFETVVIDEAAQSVELSALIPLKFGCEKCILVGDPKQLVGFPFADDFQFQPRHPTWFLVVRNPHIERMPSYANCFVNNHVAANGLIPGGSQVQLREEHIRTDASKSPQGCTPSQHPI